MSITDDMKAYADAAVEQGKRAIDQAQQALSDVRSLDRKALLDTAKRDLESFVSAVEPYVAQAKGLRDALVAKAEDLVADVRKDPRVAKAYDTAESFAGTVAETVNDRVVAPAMNLVGRKPAPAKRTSSTTTKKAPAKKAPAKKASAAKASGRKSTPRTSTATKSTARKSTARKTSPRKSTASKSTANKSTANKSTANKSTAS